LSTRALFEIGEATSVLSRVAGLSSKLDLVALFSCSIYLTKAGN